MSTTESRERGAQLTTRIAQRAVTGAKLAEALRRIRLVLSDVAGGLEVGGFTETAKQIDAEAKAIDAALAEWDSQ